MEIYPLLDQFALHYDTFAGDVYTLDTAGITLTAGTFTANVLKATGNGLIWSDGTTGTTPASGAGTRLMWIPSKYAFRAGEVTGTEWDAGNIGDYSTATGSGTTASGTGSTAMGASSTGSGAYSTAMGATALASGLGSVALGHTVTASGSYSTALGAQTTAAGNYSVALGRYMQLTADADRTFAFGHATSAVSIVQPDTFFLYDNAFQMCNSTTGPAATDGLKISLSGGDATINNQDGDLTILAGGGDISFGNEKIVTTSTGRFDGGVGVGTVPSYPFHGYQNTNSDLNVLWGENAYVGKATYARLKANSGYASMVFQSPNNIWSFGLFGDETKLQISDVTNTTYPLSIKAAAPSDSLSIDGSGDVGMGKAEAATKLHLYEDSTSTACGLTVEQDGDGDAMVQFLLTGLERWVVGVDNSDGDKFKISESTALGTNDMFILSPSETCEISVQVGIGITPTAGLTMGNDKLIALDVDSGLTASTTQSQGQGALTAQINEISTVANKDDTVTLPSAITGIEIEIINNGVNTLQIFPASGDDLGLGVNTAEELEANERVKFVAYDTTNWTKESSTEIIHAEIHDEDNTDAFVINDAGGDFHSYHTNGLAAGDLADWTFDAGGAGTSHAIASIADAGGGDITVTTGDAHNLAVGDIISQTNLADAAYVGVFDVLTVPTTTTYTVTATYTATGTGTMEQAATLEANAVAAGVYSFAYCISATPVGNNETFDFQLYKEATVVTGSKIRRKFGAGGDFGSMSGCGVVSVASGDKISLAISNEDSAANIIIRNLTIVLIRL